MVINIIGNIARAGRNNTAQWCPPAQGRDRGGEEVQFLIIEISRRICVAVPRQ